VAEPHTDIGLTTVITPARNEIDSIESCLDSILNQVGAELPLIVIEKGSVDGTGDADLAYAKRHPRVELVSSPIASRGRLDPSYLAVDPTRVHSINPTCEGFSMRFS
jgi:glycosyltransferase involved in cell wall biosynthesis